MTLLRYNHCQPAQLLEMVGNDQQIFLELANIFMHEGIKTFKKLRIAANALDMKELSYESHSLKGTVGPLGAEALMQMLISIENECKCLQYVREEKKISLIEEEIGHVRLEVQHFIGQF